MPLLSGCNPEIIQQNIDILIAEGKPVAQAIAIANADFERRCGKRKEKTLTKFFAKTINKAKNTYGDTKNG